MSIQSFFCYCADNDFTFFTNCCLDDERIFVPSFIKRIPIDRCLSNFRCRQFLHNVHSFLPGKTKMKQNVSATAIYPGLNLPHFFTDRFLYSSKTRIYYFERIWVCTFAIMRTNVIVFDIFLPLLLIILLRVNVFHITFFFSKPSISATKIYPELHLAIQS